MGFVAGSHSIVTPASDRAFEALERRHLRRHRVLLLAPPLCGVRGVIHLADLLGLHAQLALEEELLQNLNRGVRHGGAGGFGGGAGGFGFGGAGVMGDDDEALAAAIAASEAAEDSREQAMRHRDDDDDELQAGSSAPLRAPFARPLRSA